MNKTVLDNGVTILTKYMPHVRSASMGVWVNAGARDENNTENGLSHFIEHMIFKGTGKRTAYQIAKEFDSIGGQTNAFTSMELTCYHAKVMDTHLETMADILSDIFLNSKFDSEEVDKERPVILQEIGMVEDSPEEYIHMLLGRDYWGDTSLGRSILGTPENITQFDADAIKSFFQRFYQPERIVISLAGNIVHEHVLDLIGLAFSSIKTGEVLPERLTPETHAQVTLYPKTLEQVHVSIASKGIPITDPQRYAFSLMNTILGGNMSSRLFQEIRERRGLAYSVYSFFSSHVDIGMCGVYSGVAPENVLQTVELILIELDKLKEVQVDTGELQDAKEYTKGSILLSTESTDNQMVRIAQNEINYGHYIPMEEIMGHIDSVTEADIFQLANGLYNRDQIAMTLLGPFSDKKSLEDILY